MEELRRALPDDRPITGILIVEEPSRCPPGYTVIDKTFDQDTDADLWKDHFFKKITRYICISKEENDANEVVESIMLVNEKDAIPEDHVSIGYTHDTDQKAMKKKQICYKPIPLSKAKVAVTDIIVHTKNKRPPPSFTNAGDVGGLWVCFKISALPSINKSNHSSSSRAFSSNTAQWIRQTLSHQSSVIDDIPFDINPRYRDLQRLIQFTIPVIQIKSAEELYNEYSYDFQVERQTQQSTT